MGGYNKNTPKETMTLIDKFQHKVLNTASRFAFTAAVLSSAAFVSACDDDDDNKAFPSVQGKWIGNKTELVVKIEGIPTPVNETDDSFAGEVEFKANGTAVYTEDGDELQGTWSQSNDKLTLTIPDESQDIDMSGVYTIKEINSSKLKLYIEKDAAIENPDTGDMVNTNIKATLYFDKN